MVIALNLSREILYGVFNTVYSGEVGGAILVPRPPPRQVGGAALAPRPPPRPRAVQLQREGEDGREEQDSQAAASQQHCREVGLQEGRDS